jgi:hypothetical protein
MGLSRIRKINHRIMAIKRIGRRALIRTNKSTLDRAEHRVSPVQVKAFASSCNCRQTAVQLLNRRQRPFCFFD